MSQNCAVDSRVISYYIRLLAKHVRPSLNVHCMQAEFMELIMPVGCLPPVLPGTAQSFERFTGIDIVMILVSYGGQWGLAYINFKLKQIGYYGKVRTHEVDVLNALLSYLSQEYQLRNEEFSENIWTLMNVIEQDNLPYNFGNDSAIFVCMYANFFLRQRPMTFTEEHLDYFRTRVAYEICHGRILCEGY